MRWSKEKLQSHTAKRLVEGAPLEDVRSEVRHLIARYDIEWDYNDMNNFIDSVNSLLTRKGYVLEI